MLTGKGSALLDRSSHGLPTARLPEIAEIPDGFPIRHARDISTTLTRIKCCVSVEASGEPHSYAFRPLLAVDLDRFIFYYL
jgi:hypothetical protein